MVINITADSGCLEHVFQGLMWMTAIRMAKRLQRQCHSVKRVSVQVGNMPHTYGSQLF